MAFNTPKKKKRWIWIVVAAAVVLLYSFYRAGQSKAAAGDRGADVYHSKVEF